MSRRDDVVTYNGSSFGRVVCRMSIVVSAPAHKTWKVAAQFGNQGSWLGKIDGNQICTQLLGGHTVDYVGAVRVTSIAGKLMFEKLSELDSNGMHMAWHVISHPLATNPFPSSFLNCKSSLRLRPVLIPGNQSFVDWKIDLLTDLHAVDAMRRSIESIMRIGLLNIQRHFTMGGRPPVQKRLTQRLAPIAEVPPPPQPVIVSAFSSIPVPEERPQDSYVSRPAAEEQVVNPDRVDHAASYLEMTVPLLHEARPARTLLADMPRSQCGHMSNEQLLQARSGSGLRQPSHAGAQSDVVPPPVPQATEGRQREPSAELSEAPSDNERLTERSASDGDRNGSSASVWPSVAALRLARSASQPLH